VNLDEIRAALEQADGLPRQALTEALPQAPALAPAVLDLLAQAARGVHLLPLQENLLFRGLYVLAAARWTAAAPGFRDLLRRPAHELDRLLGDGLTESGSGLLLSLHDGDDDALYALLEDAGLDGTVRWIVLDVLARLAWEGRTPRDRLVGLLDRFDREAMAPLGDPAWEGWQGAILLLGLTEFEERVRAGWAAGRNAYQREIDRTDWLERLAEAVARPADKGRFIEEGIAPIDDPVAALEWTERTASGPGDIGMSDDPAEAIALTPHELDWLGGFLAGDKVPPTAMRMEQLDGFFAALVAGPEMVPPSEYLREIWSAEGDEAPVYDSPEQAALVLGLLTRHWNTIASRLAANVAHPPHLFHATPDTRGLDWAEGFVRGVALRSKAWLPLSRDREFGPLLQTILQLMANEYGEKAEAISLEERREALDALPTVLMGIHTYWRLPAAARRGPEPVRRTKVGRNDPCPCGSGKKFKKCCEGKPVFGMG